MCGGDDLEESIAGTPCMCICVGTRALKLVVRGLKRIEEEISLRCDVM